MFKVAAKERGVSVRAFRCLFLFSLLALIGVNSARAQSSTDGTTPPALTPGAPAGTYPLSDFESVNLFNGNLNFSLPMAKVGGRGAAGASMFLKIEQKWRIERSPVCSPCEPLSYPTNNWWTFANPGYAPGTMQGRSAVEGDQENGGGQHYPTYSLLRLTFTAADGTEFELRDVATNGEPKPVDGQSIFPPPGGRFYLRGTLFTTADGTSATFISCQRNGALIPLHDDESDENLVRPTGYLIMRDGTRYRIDTGLVSWMRDRNGNVTSFEYEYIDNSGQLYGRVTRITDSMGRQINIQYNINDVAPYGLCDKLTFTGYQGATRIVRVSKSSMSTCLRPDYQLRTFASLFPELTGSSATIYDDTKVSALWLPNDKSYKFFYNDYGELARVVLPTGGAIEYDWAPGVNNLPPTNGHPASGVFNDNVYRRVTTRRVYPSGGSGTAYENRTTYSIPETLTAPEVTNAGYVLAYQYSQSGSVLSRTKHYFEGFASYNPYIYGLAPFGRIYYVPWKWGKETKTETLDPTDETIVLRRVETNFEQRSHVLWWTGPAIEEPPNDPRLTFTLTTLADVSPNLVSKQSAVNPQTGEVGFDQYNNQTDVWEFDYGQGAPGSLLRHTVTQYVTSGYDTVPGGPTDPDVGATIHLRSLVLSRQIFDAGGTQRAQVSYEYDNYNQNSVDANHAPLLSRAGIIGIFSRKGKTIDQGYVPNSDYSRGNATKVSRWLNTGGSVDAYTQYDIAGNVIKTIDPKGNPTLIDYSSSFQYGLPTQTTGPVPDPAGATGSSSAFTTFANYDFSIGLPISITDANGQTTFVDYSDLLDRLKSVVRPAGGGSTTYTYGDDVGNLFLRTQTTQDASQTLMADQLFDPMGRAIETRQFEPGGGYVSTKQNYDGMGRVSQTSNPFRPASESAVWSTRTYDTFGRVTAITTPDQALSRTDYSGNRVLATDQASKQRLSKTDSLGQLTDLWEIRSADSATESVTFPNHPEVTAGYRTSYLYNALEDLVKVTQGSQNRYFMYDSLKRLIRSRNPEQDTAGGLALSDPVTNNSQWCVSYEYDNNGNLFRKTDSRTTAVTTTYGYDAINRVVSRAYSDSTPSVNYRYDGAGVAGGVSFSKGRLTLVSSSVSSYSHDEYDQMGRAKRGTQTTAGQSYQMSYGYDFAGNMISETYPSGRIISSGYDNAGRLTAVNGQKTGEGNKTYASQYNYWSHGPVKSMQLGNSKWEHSDYNNRLQPTLIGLGTSSTDSSILRLDYGYGTTANNGNVLSQNIVIGGTTISQSYSYDALNRLQTASENSGASWSQTYGYDRFGNRWVSASPGYTLSSLTPTGPGGFNTANNRLTAGGYDAPGNQTLDGLNRSFEYDGENRQTKFNGSVGQYSYDGDGRRVKKIDSTGTMIFVYNVEGQLIAEYHDDPVPSPAGGGGTSYLTTDQLGSTRVVTKSDGTVKARYDYLPFGEELGSGIGGRTVGSGYSAADSTKQRFTQKERDNESGLDYFGARYYSGAQGRFTSVDPILSSGKDANPQSWNRYVYVFDNPMRWVDPSGLETMAEEEARKRQAAQAAADIEAARKAIDEIAKNGGNLIIFVAGILNPTQESTKGSREAAAALEGWSVNNVVSASNGSGFKDGRTGAANESTAQAVAQIVRYALGKLAPDQISIVAHSNGAPSLAKGLEIVKSDLGKTVEFNSIKLYAPNTSDKSVMSGIGEFAKRGGFSITVSKRDSGLFAGDWFNSRDVNRSAKEWKQVLQNVDVRIIETRQLNHLFKAYVREEFKGKTKTL